MASAESSNSTVQPIYFISHGAPSLFDEKEKPAYKYLAKLASTLPAKPRAIVSISAHWEASPVEVTSSTKLIYDFYGFPKHMYSATWPAPEDPELAKRIVQMIKDVEPSATYNAKRGIDHGTWSPLKIVYPDADIPTVQVSLKKGLDLDFHIKLGEALRPLAKENILIFASGGSTHNLGEAFSSIGGKSANWALEFEKFVGEVAELSTSTERNAAFAKSDKHPAFRKAHPTEEHFVPLLVASGAAAGKGHLEHLSWMTPNFGMSCIRFDAE